MASKAFIKGFRHELANRAFAFLAIERMAERFAGHEHGLFWKSYLDLEVFNGPRYAHAARRWGLGTAPGLFTRLKALAVSSLPARLHGPLLRFIYRETLKYLQWLKKLRRQGPANARGFLEYMVEQEEVQLEMMRLALAGRYTEIAGCADDFFLKYGSSVRFFDGGAADRPG
ncbi:hypothetical protein [Metapseudomonas resinovorans]|uniref:Uncharacterized protein n=1 Tax=Metapseudomonas resinovorans NBRC 106553 TaxID=1245471 RepID=S6AUR8_METRE|nr:hypothetical protein [Pseudomonas resinovorans]BAN48081.1 hypothetical protein PCA10_23490 [Pseudomonas resinovorans NBRC 106553]